MKEIEIPEGYKARIEGNKVIIELKESEDDRIRKNCVHFLELQKAHHADTSEIDDCIAYLEKQKEQKPDCKYGCGLTDEQLMATDFWKEYLKESIIPGNKPTKADIDFLLPIARKYFSLVMKEACTICKDWSNGYQEGLEAGRQKPTEWHPTHEQMVALNWAANVIDNNSPCAGDIKASLRSLYNDLQSKSIRLAEWSERDKKIILSLHHALNCADAQFTIVRDGLEVGDVDSWLESLHPQPKQERSEEDKRNLYNVIEAVKYVYDVSEDSSGSRLITWLKSFRPQLQQNMSIGFMLYLDEHRPEGKMCLSNAECNQIETAFKNQDWDTIIRYIEKYRPHWKPSEEQITALEASYSVLKTHDTWDEDEHLPILMSLINDLQKLVS